MRRSKGSFAWLFFTLALLLAGCANSPSSDATWPEVSFELGKADEHPDSRMFLGVATRDESDLLIVDFVVTETESQAMVARSGDLYSPEDWAFMRNIGGKSAYTQFLFSADTSQAHRAVVTLELDRTHRKAFVVHYTPDG